MPDSSNSIANAMELLQFCIKPLIYSHSFKNVVNRVACFVSTHRIDYGLTVVSCIVLYFCHRHQWLLLSFHVVLSFMKKIKQHVYVKLLNVIVKEKKLSGQSKCYSEEAYWISFNSLIPGKSVNFLGFFIEIIVFWVKEMCSQMTYMCYHRGTFLEAFSVALLWCSS